LVWHNPELLLIPAKTNSTYNETTHMKFLIVPACTDLNRGDQALVWESANLLFDAFGPEINVKIVDYGNSYEERFRQSEQTRAAGYEVIRNLVENPKRSISDSHSHLGIASYFKVALTAALDFIRQILLVLLPHEIVARIIFRDAEKVASFESLRTSDGVVVKGGGFIHTYGHLQDPYYLWFNLYYAILAIRLRKKVIIFPNSFGPVQGRINQMIVRTIVNRCTLVYTRESRSLNCLKQIGCKKVKASHDLAYYASTDIVHLKTIDIPESKKQKIGITVRPYRFPESLNPVQSYERYISSIAEFCDMVKNYKIYFIVQVQGPSAHENDRVAISDVINKCNREDIEIIDGPYNYNDLIFVYSKMDYLIGTRFHSVVFSQLSGVPSLAIAYGGNKSQGIMQEIDLSEFVIDINNISGGEIALRFENLTKEKEAYGKKLLAFRSQLPASRAEIINDLKWVFS